MHNLFTLLRLLILLFVPTTTAFWNFQLTSYAPLQAQCPSDPLVRTANGLSAGETQYIEQRDAKAQAALGSFLGRLNQNRASNDTFPAISGNMPRMAFASSGGGVRALLAGAGVIQAMDNRDLVAASSSVSGLWQAMSYHTGLSGGAWLLGALAGNPGALVSQLQIDLWATSFSDPSFLPLGKRGPDTFARFFLDIIAKAWAGFDVGLVDAWGRLISQNLIEGENSGEDTTLSGLLNNSNFQAYDWPYPIITALGPDPTGDFDGCVYADLAATQYEL